MPNRQKRRNEREQHRREEETRRRIREERGFASTRALNRLKAENLTVEIRWESDKPVPHGGTDAALARFAKLYQEELQRPPDPREAG